MNRTGHYLFTTATVLAPASIPPDWPTLGMFHVSPDQAWLAAVLALPFTVGKLSPDVDQLIQRVDIRKPFRRIKQWTHDVFGHRRFTHDLTLPLSVLVTLLVLGVPYAFCGPVLGWVAHLWPADWMWGRGGADIPRGISIFYGVRLGLGCKVGGRLEAIFSWGVLLPVIVWLVLDQIGAI